MKMNESAFCLLRLGPSLKIYFTGTLVFSVEEGLASVSKFLSKHKSSKAVSKEGSINSRS